MAIVIYTGQKSCLLSKFIMLCIKKWVFLSQNENFKKKAKVFWDYDDKIIVGVKKPKTKGVIWVYLNSLICRKKGLGRL